MAGRFDSTSVQGLSEMRAAFKRAPEVTRLRLGEAVEQTAFAVLQRAKALVRVRSGSLKSALNYAFNDKTGEAKVGVERDPLGGSGGAGVAMPSKYAHLVEFGHEGPHPAAAHPFMLPSAEAEREPYLQRCHAAGQAIERDLSTVGGSFL
jgi:hypothetical protein